MLIPEHRRQTTDDRKDMGDGEQFFCPPSSVLCPLKTICFIFCLSPAWWLLRSDKTRSHPELGRQTLQRRWYYVSRPGRVGRCQACQRQKNPLQNVRSLAALGSRAALSLARGGAAR